MGNLEVYLFRQKHEKLSDKWVELSLLKEELLDELNLINKELNSVDEYKIIIHHKNIIINELERRRTQIKNFLDRTLTSIEDLEKTNNSD